jgi:hypothetical protein
MTERESLPSPEERPLLRFLGGATPAFEDEASAPPVDVEQLRRYYRTAVEKTDELNESSRKQIRGLIAKYRSWYTAFNDVIDAQGQSGN